jgi:diaminopimelate epimerase
MHQYNSPIKVQVQNGDVLEVDFKQANGEFTDVKLTGPAKIVFEGKIEI